MCECSAGRIVGMPVYECWIRKKSSEELLVGASKRRPVMYITISRSASTDLCVSVNACLCITLL